MTIMKKNSKESRGAEEDLETDNSKDIPAEEESSDDGNESYDSEKDTIEGNAGWVDSISKILKTKKPKGKKTLVLAKAKKLTDPRKQKVVDPGFSIEGETKEETDVEKLLNKLEPHIEPPRKKRKDLPQLRIKPNVLERDRERTLSKIATRGVVQLFNAVRNQQKEIDKKLDEAGPLERKRENVLKSIDKRAFLDILMGEKSEQVRHTTKSAPVNEKSWNVLRDDFMMGAKLKDWDKELETEEIEEECVAE